MDKKKAEWERKLATIRELMEELEKDPAVRDLMERNQLRYGTLTESDLKKVLRNEIWRKGSCHIEYSKK